MLWHYTIRDRWHLIERDGVIKLATASVHTTERAAVWFTTRTEFEPTARKLRVDSLTICTLEEMRQLGMFRIGVDASVAPYNWVEFKRRSRILPGVARGLEIVAQEQGSCVDEWFVSFAPVPRPKWKRVQVFRMEQWIDYPLD